jgi:hypothetical protein
MHIRLSAPCNVPVRLHQYAAVKRHSNLSIQSCCLILKHAMLHSERRLLGPCSPLEQEYSIREVYSEEVGEAVVYIEESSDSPTHFADARCSLDSGSDRSLAADIEFAQYCSDFLNSDAIDVLSVKEKLLFTSLLDAGKLSEAMSMVQRLVSPGDDDVSSEDLSSVDDEEDAEYVEQVCCSAFPINFFLTFVTLIAGLGRNSPGRAVQAMRGLSGL